MGRGRGWLVESHRCPLSSCVHLRSREWRPAGPHIRWNQGSRVFATLSSTILEFATNRTSEDEACLREILHRVQTRRQEIASCAGDDQRLLAYQPRFVIASAALGAAKHPIVRAIQT